MNTNLSEMLVNKDQATELWKVLWAKGSLVPNNRILIMSPIEGKTKSGIIIPGVAQDTIPKKGVIIQQGSVTNEELTFALELKPGDIVTYGLYSGTKVEPIGLEIPKDQELRVISLHEIMYCETQK